jgi:hypothetical protein
MTRRDTSDLIPTINNGFCSYLPDSAQKREKHVIQVGFSLHSAIPDLWAAWFTSKAHNRQKVFFIKTPTMIRSKC